MYDLEFDHSPEHHILLHNHFTLLEVFPGKGVLYWWRDRSGLIAIQHAASSAGIGSGSQKSKREGPAIEATIVSNETVAALERSASVVNGESVA